MEYQVQCPNTDAITKARFARHSTDLLISSWDGQVYLCGSNSSDSKVRLSYSHTGPVLDCCWGVGDAQTFSGGVDRRLKVCDLATGKDSTLGTHDHGIRCVEFNMEGRWVITGSWDSTVKLWDPRSSTALIATLPQTGKVFALAETGCRVVVGTSDRTVAIYDVRNMSTPEQTRESSLKHQTRAIKVFPDQRGYILTSIEGRVAIEYFDTSSAVQAKKYAFKCHRSKHEGGGSIAYPVNSAAFHPVYGTFATGGCDGMVLLWDGMNKKRITQLPKYPSSIASLDFSADGKLLAITSSYTYEMGDRQEQAKDEVYVHVVEDKEVVPKHMLR